MIEIVIDKTFLDALSTEAKVSTRLRSHHCLHKTYQDKVQRVYIAAEPGTYIRPHAHMEVDKWEYISVIRGAVDFLLFSHEGKLQQRIPLQAGGEASAIEVSPGTWHTLLVRQAGTILFEVKPGPFDAASIASFADWAPEENSMAVNEYMKTLSSIVVA